MIYITENEEFNNAKWNSKGSSPQSGARHLPMPKVTILAYCIRVALDYKRANKCDWGIFPQNQKQ